jgi:ABC-type cobalamin transport system permease subunit
MDKPWLIVQNGLRGKLGMLMDRLSSGEVMQALLDVGLAERKLVGPSEGLVMCPVEATDLEESEHIAWLPMSDRLWA